MRIVAISDTHMQHEWVTLPYGDILIHAGDFSNRGSEGEFQTFLNWMGKHPHPHKILVPGNHDKFCEGNEAQCSVRCADHDIVFQTYGFIRVMDLTVMCSSWTPKIWDGDPWSFVLDRDHPRFLVFDELDKCDILIAHGPPRGCVDVLEDRTTHVGENHLLSYIERTSPKVSIHGHIHEAFGSDRIGDTRVYNVSICDLKYRPVNPVTVIDLEV